MVHTNSHGLFVVRPAPLSPPPPPPGATRRLIIRWLHAPVFGALPLELAMMSTVSTAWIAGWLLLHALAGSALAAAEGGSPGACARAEACVEEASEDDPVALLQAPERGAAVAAGADEDWWRRRAGRSAAAAGAVVGSMTGEEPAESSHTKAVQTQDLLTPSVGLVAVGGAADKRCKESGEDCYDKSECCSDWCFGKHDPIGVCRGSSPPPN
ncbi:unnamed protein product [Polarella glacialis]|uniref:Uncharacterized protein n=1 Tax=Polarella glacialis TaxID=89957 RepID=A0A813JPY6_POLGL|nr:unnamed protein product [Polarella glacialis]